MKKLIFAISIAAALLACNKNIYESTPDPAENDGHLKLNISIDGEDPDTRSVIKDWSNADCIYLFFDEAATYPPQYLRIKYDKFGSVTGTAKSWYVDQWYGEGLEATLAGKTSGKLGAFYCVNDKMGGSIDVSYSKMSSSNNNYVYRITPQDRNGGTFYAYWMFCSGINYTVSNGTLSANLSMKAQGKWCQYCIYKDASGTSFINSETERYKLTVRAVSGAQRTDSPLNMPRYFSPATASMTYDYVSNQTYLSGYICGGLCFSDLGTTFAATSTGQGTVLFYITDTKGTSSTSDDIIYQHSITLVGAMPRAVRLPDLNALKSNGTREWVVVDSIY